MRRESFWRQAQLEALGSFASVHELNRYRKDLLARERVVEEALTC